MKQEEKIKEIERKIEEAKKERIDEGINRLETLKRISTKISTVILMDEAKVTEEEIETILTLLKIDLKSLSEKSFREKQYKAKKDRLEFLQFKAMEEAKIKNLL